MILGLPRWGQGAGALLHVSADVSPGMLVRPHGTQGKPVDDVVRSGCDDGQHHPTFETGRTVSWHATVKPALGAHLRPVVADWLDFPGSKGVPPTVFKVVGVDFFSFPIETNGFVAGGGKD